MHPAGADPDTFLALATDRGLDVRYGLDMGTSIHVRYYLVQALPT